MMVLVMILLGDFINILAIKNYCYLFMLLLQANDYIPSPFYTLILAVPPKSKIIELEKQ
jgi:hypothetical protein